MNTPLLYPSLMCMSPLEVRRDLEVICRSFDGVHVDIMDGHFCKSIHLSPALVEAIRPECTVPIDVHLMVESPVDFLEDLARCGADSVTIHIESVVRDAHRMIDRLRALDVGVGIALCPTTPLSAVEDLLVLVDMVTVLAVDPGFIGQEMIPSTPSRVERLVTMREGLDADYLIQVDGGVRSANFFSLAKAGADCFVLGKGALFARRDNLEAACSATLAEFRPSSPLSAGRDDE
ncbi:MAG: ribulose-phosphate 3-epimerase [Deltaproteobacteria bacterium]|nr:ribulose-phosphate 3-epimerase [Deltaproteobacteria bacterium]